MSCDRLTDEQLIDGLEEGWAEPWMETHLQECGPCMERLEEFRSIMAGVRALAPHPEVPAAVDEALFDKLAALPKPRRLGVAQLGPSRASRGGLPGQLLRVAAMVLIVFGLHTAYPWLEPYLTPATHPARPDIALVPTAPDQPIGDGASQAPADPGSDPSPDATSAATGSPSGTGEPPTTSTGGDTPAVATVPRLTIRPPAPIIDPPAQDPLLALLEQYRANEGGVTQTLLTSAALDRNGDGRVDVIDGMLLSRQLLATGGAEQELSSLIALMLLSRATAEVRYE